MPADLIFDFVDPVLFLRYVRLSRGLFSRRSLVFPVHSLVVMPPKAPVQPEASVPPLHFVPLPPSSSTASVASSNPQNPFLSDLGPSVAPGGSFPRASHSAPAIFDATYGTGPSGGILPPTVAATLRSADITHPSVRSKTVNGSGWPASLRLSFTDHNWAEWYRQLGFIMKISGLGGYLDGTAFHPDLAYEPRAAAAYHENDQAVLAFLQQKLDETELLFVDACENAEAAISTLRARHLNRGPAAQVLLLSQLLGTQFSRAAPLADTLTSMTQLNNRIWDGAPPTRDSILLIAAINGLKDEFSELSSQFTTLLTSGTLTIGYVSDRLAAEQQAISAQASPPTVLTTSAASSKPKSNPFRQDAKSLLVCSNKAHCGESGHSIETCIKQGGGMAGRSIDEARAAKRLLREKLRFHERSE